MANEVQIRKLNKQIMSMGSDFIDTNTQLEIISDLGMMDFQGAVPAKEIAEYLDAKLAAAQSQKEKRTILAVISELCMLSDKSLHDLFGSTNKSIAPITVRDMLHIIPSGSAVCIEPANSEEPIALGEITCAELSEEILKLEAEEVYSEKYPAIGRTGITIKV